MPLLGWILQPLKMEKENIKTNEPRIEKPEIGKLGTVFPERVEEMKKRSKEDRNKIACTELLPLNSKDVLAARQAQIDLKEVQEGPANKSKKK